MNELHFRGYYVRAALEPIVPVPRDFNGRPRMRHDNWEKSARFD